MDIEITKRFVKEYPDFESSLIQVFDDVENRKDKKLAREAMRRSDATLQQLVELNQQWAGVFFSINAVCWSQRLQKNVSGIKARVVEIDSLSKEEQLQLLQLSPLHPSLVVESKRSYHFYRFAKDGVIENRRKIMWWIRNFFGGDHKIITEERVLRLPWFDHCKSLDDRFETTYFPQTKTLYTEQEMLFAFPDTTDRKEQEKQLKSQDYSLSKSDDGFWTKAKQINAEYMLWLLSWTKRVNWEKIEVRNKQIWVNEKSTSSRIDEKWFIWSHDNGWPLRTNWIARYGTVDRKELYKRTIEKLPHLKEERKTENKKETSTDRTQIDAFLVPYDRNFEIDTKTKVPFTWWSVKLDNYFGKIEKWRFMTTIWESGSGKTTRAFSQAIEISRYYKTLFVSLEMDAQRVIELRARKMAWITNEERNDKSIPQGKLDYMELRKSEITSNKNLEIVGVNKEAEMVHIDLIIEAIKARYMDFDWIVIDNLWFIKWDDDDMYKELNSIVRKVKEFCHKNNKNINLLHHFNKGKSWQSRRDRTFADVLGTGKLEHDVDYWVFIIRYLEDRENLTEEEKQQVFIRTAKNRDTWEVKKGILYFRKGKYRDEYQPI